MQSYCQYITEQVCWERNRGPCGKVHCVPMTKSAVLALIETQKEKPKEDLIEVDMNDL